MARERQRWMEMMQGFRNDSRSNADAVSAMTRSLEEIDRRQARIYDIVQTSLHEARDFARAMVKILRK